MIAGFMFTTSCSDGNEMRNVEPLNINLTRSEEQALKGVNKFTFDLMREVDKDRKEKDKTPNFILSPQGAAWCLAMVANGVEPGSESEEELFRVLGFDNGESVQDLNEYSEKLIKALTSDKTGGSIRIANAVYYKNSLRVYKDFLETLNLFYNTKEFPEHKNSQIDKWVSDRTKGRIKNFGTDNDVEKKYFGVLNTITFDGEWHSPFDPKYTKPREFRNEDGTVSTPETMSETFRSVLRSDEICHMLRMSLKNNVFLIHFVLPAEGHTISDVIEHLDGDVWSVLNRPVESDTEEERYTIRLPKFKYADNYDLFEIANNMGLESFIVGADLTRLCENTEFAMTNFNQSVSFEIEEKGVKAASTTNYGGAPTAVYLPSNDFYMDEPFLFFITEESTGAILFAGKIGQL